MRFQRYFPLLFALLLVGPARAFASPGDSTLVRRNHPMYVRIDLDHNQLALMSGEHVMWAAPVGTGTGLKLQAGKQTWEFSTPQGEFAVLFKELDPVWIRPNWYYQEKGLPVPADTSSERWAYGELGPAAIYFAPELAIHGTSRPELLGQNVSHGCIRLSNEDVMRLYHDVRPGTPVVIVGTPRAARDSAGAAPTRGVPRRTGTLYSRGRRLGADSAQGTAALLGRFDRERAATYQSSDWTLTGGELVERAAQGDTAALRGLLERGSGSGDWAYERELSAFLAGLYFRRPVESLQALGALDERGRTDVAFAIVRAALDLYPGPLDARAAPWPSAAVPALRERPGVGAGLRAVEEAEARYLRLFAERAPLAAVESR